MSKLNVKPKDFRIDTSERLAGGYGPHAAKQSPEALLRRCVMASLLWENLFYTDGKSNTDQIKLLIPQVEPAKVAAIAIEARQKQKLRHVPLLIAREMARLPEHKRLVGEVLPQIITRADQLTDYLALYWADGKTPISKQVKLGLGRAFQNFNAYAIAKYNRDATIKLRDALFMIHARPKDAEQAALWKQLVEDKLPIPDTWEVALSKLGADKQAAWTRLITEKKLGGLAFLRNLRNCQQAGVSHHVMRQGFENLRGTMLLPLNFLAAQQAAPDYTREIESAMLKCYADLPKLPGFSVFVLDVSGSMGRAISAKSRFNRLDAGAAMMLLASEQTERVKLYLTAGSDPARAHQTQKITPVRGFGLLNEIQRVTQQLGGGGIFTRQCLEYIKVDLKGEIPDRIVIFSDSQDCDEPGRGLPRPFGRRNYLADVSAESHGVNYEGLWTAEIMGWSEHLISYIAATEGLDVSEAEEGSLQ